jgi:glycosyltransferase involved in cell wall biosynthesis
MILSVILPNHQEERIQETIDECEKTGIPFEIIISCDRYSKGKGWALREGLKEAKGNVICFLDSDMDIHPRMIRRLLPFIDDYDIVVGTKKIQGLWCRKIVTLLSRIYIRLLFNIGVETQTGIKLFKRYVLEDWKEDNFSFDLEILAKAKKNNYKMIEVPIEATITKNVSLKTVIKTLIGSLKIYANLNRN